MNDMAFGTTMTLMGMGVTLLTIVLLMLVIQFLLKLFPYKKEEPKEKE